MVNVKAAVLSIRILTVSILFYDFIEFIILLHTYLVISFA